MDCGRGCPLSTRGGVGGGYREIFFFIFNLKMHGFSFSRHVYCEKKLLADRNRDWGA